MDWVLAALILCVVLIVSYTVAYVMTDSSRLKTMESLHEQKTSLEKEKIKVYIKS